MKIVIVCVGKIREKYFRDAVLEYSKRLGKYVNLEIVEVADEKAPETLSGAEEEIVKNKEGEKIFKSVKKGYNVALALEGQKMTSVGFSEFISRSMVRGINQINFIVGGSLGLSDNVLKTADVLLSFSDMTFPHQLMRVILLEQIYRAYRIIHNEPYHK